MVLVTGATGILGRVIVLELLKLGKKVRAAKRCSGDLEEVKNSMAYYAENAEFLFRQIQWVDLDLKNCNSLTKALVGIEEVYHCAAMLSYDPQDLNQINQVNVGGTSNLLKCCRTAGVEKFLFVSSATVYKSKNDEIITENSTFIETERSTVYALSKLRAEKAVCEAAAKGMKTIIINPGLIIGSGKWNEKGGGLINILATRNYTFPGGTGFADVRDVAKIAVLLMSKGLFGSRFLVSSENVTYREISNHIKCQLRDKKSWMLSTSILRLSCAINRLTGSFIRGLRMLTAPNVEFLTSFYKLSNCRVSKILDYQFIPLEESLSFHIGNFLDYKSSHSN